MHGDSDRINRRMSSSLRCFPCLVIIAHNNFHHIVATGFIDWDESTASTLYVKKHTLYHHATCCCRVEENHPAGGDHSPERNES
jgi:hypothetical protein